jgi:hypothetical protein
VRKKTLQVSVFAATSRGIAQLQKLTLRFTSANSPVVRIHHLLCMPPNLLSSPIEKSPNLKSLETVIKVVEGNAGSTSTTVAEGDAG